MDLRHILLEVTAETGDAERDLRRLAGEVEGFGRLSADARLGIDASRLRAELAAATGEITAFRRQNADATLGLNKANFDRQLAEARAELAAFGRQRASAGLGTSPLRDALTAERAVNPPGGGGKGPPGGVPDFAQPFEEGARRAQQASRQGAQAVSDSWIGAALNIRAVMTVAMTGLVAAIAAVAPEIVLLAASLVGAATAAGGLATAFAGALGPALLAVVPLISGLSKVFAAFKIDQQNKDIRQSILGRQQLANAAISQLRAEQSLAIARRDAGRGIRDAIHADQQATQSVANAQLDLKFAVRDAYRAWQDSINGVIDATLALKDSQLGVQRAQLVKQQALLDLRNMRKELAATGTELDHFFGQITEVQLDPRRIQALLPEVDRLGLTAQQAIDVKNKMLDLQTASLGVKEAEQKRVEVEQRLARAIEDRNRFEKLGIRAYRPLLAAQQALADATWASARANEHLADVRKQGVAHNPQVLAAQDALRSAQQQQAAATNKAVDAWDKVPRALRVLRGPLRELKRAWTDVRTEVARAWGPVLVGALRGAGRMLDGFRGHIASLAQTQANAAAKFLGGLGSRRSQLFFDRMFALSEQLTTVLTSAFGHLLGFFANVADAATKPLERVSLALDSTFGKWDRDTRSTTSGGKRMKQIFDEGTTILGKWLHLIGAVGKVFLSFFHATVDQQGTILDSLTKTVNKWNDWINANPDKIREFFAKVLPAGARVMRGLGKLFELLIAVFPTLVDAVSRIFDVLGFWIDRLKDIFHFLDKLLPQGAAGVGTALLGILAPIALITKAFHTLTSGAKGFGKGLFSGTGLEARAEKLGKSLGSRLRKGLGKIIGRDLGGATDGAAAGAEQRTAIIQGGTAAATEIRTAMLQAGTTVAAEIAAAMRGGGFPTGGGGRRPPGEEPLPPGTILGPNGKPLPPRTPPRAGGVLGRLRGFIGGASIGPLGFTGGVLATGLGVLGAAKATLGNSQAAFPTRLAKSLQGFASGATLGLIPSPSSFNAKLKALEDQSIRSFNFGKRLGEHSRAAILAFGGTPGGGVGSGSAHSGLATGILNQLRVSFRNLGERATGGLSTLRRAFNANLGQISEDIPKHTRSWSRAVSENTRRMIQAVARNVRQGRIPVREGFEAIRREMASRSLRGRDQVVAAFRSAAAGIRRWMRDGKTSTQTYTDQMDEITKTLLRRMHQRVSSFTKSYRTAFSNMVQSGIDAKKALDAIKGSQGFGAAGGSEGAANDRGDPFARPRRRRGPTRVVSTRSTGGVLPGYGGGDVLPNLLEAGEGILKKETVRALGADFINRLNSDPLGALRSHGYVAPGIAGVRKGASASGGRHIDNHFNITTAPRPDLAPDPQVVAAQLSSRMRTMGLA